MPRFHHRTYSLQFSHQFICQKLFKSWKIECLRVPLVITGFLIVNLQFPLHLWDRATLKLIIPSPSWKAANKMSGNFPSPNYIVLVIFFMTLVSLGHFEAHKLKSTLPETNIAPEYGWLEDEISFWGGLFSGAFAVSFREGNLYTSFFQVTFCFPKWRSLNPFSKVTDKTPKFGSLGRTW